MKAMRTTAIVWSVRYLFITYLSPLFKSLAFFKV